MTSDQDITAELLPRPQTVERVSEVFYVSPETRIFSGAGFPAQRLQGLIEEEFGLHLTIEDGEKGKVLIGESHNNEKKPSGNEGYFLEVGQNGAVIEAENPEGLLWGVMTFRQLLRKKEKRVFAEGVRIADRPHYRWRGFMIDSGRAPNSVAKMKRIVRICSVFKLNLLIFREGDDELNAVRYKTNLLGSTNPKAICIEEMAEFIEYGRQYGVTVVPEIESLGHSGAKGFHYPELVEGGFKTHYEGIGDHIRKSHLRPGNSKGLDLLASIYREWFGIIKSPFVHLGMDEVRLPRDIQENHFEMVLTLVDRVSREIRPMVWADAPATPQEYAAKVIRCLWSYEEHGELDLTGDFLKGQGIEELMKAGCGQEAFMVGGSGSKHEAYSKSEYAGAFRNLALWSRAGMKHPNFTGLIAAQWGGNMIDDWLPDFLAAAQFGWNPPEEVPEYQPLMDRIQGQLMRLNDVTDPKGEEIDSPAWDGIWLKGREWFGDIMR